MVSQITNSKYTSMCYAYAKQMNECANANLDSTNAQSFNTDLLQCHACCE